ncbi:hypothetical protein UFOVP1655_52 [uncultured Caudovirales phage]|uniref:Uncharacterized protein n=1 Tax=uncultured Caudovirales phage TaxID=2100421 RepID=A0A6J5T5R7_9CAUD|nr:hypothetical protein UFOVP1655_52 [uncultured Caudovirales phage]
MKRYTNGLFGNMKESKTGEWVSYSLFESERLLLEDLAASRLDIIQERNSTIILKQKEIEEIHIKYQGLLDSMNNQNMSLQGFVGGQDNTINKLEAINKKLNIQSKFSDIKHDIFIFSAVLNAILSLALAAMYFGGV